MNIPTRKLGKTGAEVTIFGLGGEGVLRTYGHEDEAYDLINRAIDLGINYFESARAYSGSESYYGLALKERRKPTQERVNGHRLPALSTALYPKL